MKWATSSQRFAPSRTRTEQSWSRFSDRRDTTRCGRYGVDVTKDPAVPVSSQNRSVKCWLSALTNESAFVHF
jgi:aminopeptidase C